MKGISLLLSIKGVDRQIDKCQQVINLQVNSLFFSARQLKLE